ncbi:MAG: prolipoprotein diacylglyceryl transferase [Oscillospiraceae bacterium]|jgi:phosphatidylglycerol:prolipoprotein diacylglycerol transferase|nr:prolipoprotein diacylglyceryl transferase [Oscillospiraceae bacterium]
MPTISFPLLGNYEFNFDTYFSVFGWKVHYYGVIIALGFLLAVIYALKRSREFGIDPDSITDMLLFGLPLGIIGARIYYIAFSGTKWTFLQALQIWNGGLAVYGGIIGAALGILLFGFFKRRRNYEFRLAPFLDVAALGFLIGQSIGRWGNFVNREAFGTATDLPWKMGLTSNGVTLYFHPTFLYESLWNALGFVLLHIYSKRAKNRYSGQIAVLYIWWYGLGRVFIEGLRSDSLYLFGSDLRVSQLLAALCVVAGVGLNILLSLRAGKRSRKLAEIPAVPDESELDAEFTAEQQDSGKDESGS